MMQKFRVHGTRAGDFAVVHIIAHKAEAALEQARKVFNLIRWKYAVPEPACTGCGRVPVDCTCGGEWMITDGRMVRRVVS
jgi:hypothetical protein